MKRFSVLWILAFILGAVTLWFVVGMFAGCTKEGPTGPAGPPGPPGTPDDLTNPNILPQVLFTQPASNAIGPFNLFTPFESYTKPHFVIRFNKYMAKSSFTSRTVVCQGFDRPVAVRLFQRYILPYVSRPTGVKSELYDNVLEFMIHDSIGGWWMPYRVRGTYTVVLGTLIEDINGNHLTQRYQFSFTPEPQFRVVDITPKNGSTDATQSLSIRVSFNTYIEALVFGSLQLSPSVAGRWRLNRYDSTVATFTSATAVPFNTACTATVLGTARDRYGNPIDRSYSSSFAITAFAVRSTFPPNGATQVWPMSSPYIKLTAPADTGTVRQALSIVPPLSCRIRSYGHDIYINPSFGLAPSTTYTLTLSTALRAHDGTALQSPATVTFTTSPFEVEYTNPDYGALNVSRESTISVDMTAVLDTSTIRSSFSISPQANLRFSMYEGSARINAVPSPQLDANTMYTVTIGTTLRSKSGASLQAPYSFVFTTSR